MSTYTDQKINLVINKLTKDQYEQAKSQGIIDDTQLYMITDDRGSIQGDTRYALINKTLSLSSITLDGVQTQALTCNVDDLAITTIQVSSDTYPVAVYLPKSSANGSRDFCVRVEALSSSVPTLCFLGSNQESCDFESEDENWATLEVGANLFNFTETKRQ